jgi:hypothetical protein
MCVPVIMAMRVVMLVIVIVCARIPGPVRVTLVGVLVRLRVIAAHSPYSPNSVSDG